MKISIFPGKYHQNGGFSMAMLVYRRVDDATTLLWCDLSKTRAWWFRTSTKGPRRITCRKIASKPTSSLEDHGISIICRCISSNLNTLKPVKENFAWPNKPTLFFTTLGPIGDIWKVMIFPYSFAHLEAPTRHPRRRHHSTSRATSYVVKPSVGEVCQMFLYLQPNHPLETNNQTIRGWEMSISLFF